MPKLEKKAPKPGFSLPWPYANFPRTLNGRFELFETQGTQKITFGRWGKTWPKFCNVVLSKNTMIHRCDAFTCCRTWWVWCANEIKFDIWVISRRFGKLSGKIADDDLLSSNFFPNLFCCKKKALPSCIKIIFCRVGLLGLLKRFFVAKILLSNWLLSHISCPCKRILTQKVSLSSTESRKPPETSLGSMRSFFHGL